MAHRGVSSVSVNTIVPISNNKPGALRILRTTARPIIIESTCVSKKVIVRGVIHVDIEYVAQTSWNIDPILLVSYELPILSYIYCRRANENSEAYLTAEIEYQDYKLEGTRNIVIYLIAKIKVRRCRRKNFADKSRQSAITRKTPNTVTLSQSKALEEVPKVIVQSQPVWNSWKTKISELVGTILQYQYRGPF